MYSLISDEQLVLEEMVSLGPGAILGLTSLLIGLVGISWAAANSHAFAKPYTDQILDQLEELQDTITILNYQLHSGFEHTFKFIEQEQCFQKMNEPIQRIIYSYKHLIKYLRDDLNEEFKSSFMQSCSGMICDKSLFTLFQFVNGNHLKVGGCDLLNMLYENGEIEPDTGLPTRGDRNVLIKRAAFVVGVVNMGLLVQSSYLDLRDE
jgi:hypothetical protein